jgi:AraC family transcriptional regulator
LINQIGSWIPAEMANESAAGRMFVETASLILAARPIDRYCDNWACVPTEPGLHQPDHRRLRRVRDYIAVHSMTAEI